MIRLLIADDEALLRFGFRMALQTQADFAVVGEADDGEQAVALTASLRPDVVLMDVRMPVLDGIAATRQIQALPHPASVLVLTTFNLDEYVFAALRAGAVGFLLKNVPPADLFAGIRCVATGEAVAAPAATRTLIDSFATRLPATPPTPPAAIDQLTAREREILLEIARGKSNSEIAASQRIAEGTVKIHVGRILSKLELRSRVHAVIFAYESGLVRPP